MTAGVEDVPPQNRLLCTLFWVAGTWTANAGRYFFWTPFIFYMPQDRSSQRNSVVTEAPLWWLDGLIQLFISLIYLKQQRLYVGRHPKGTNGFSRRSFPLCPLGTPETITVTWVYTDPSRDDLCIYKYVFICLYKVSISLTGTHSTSLTVHRSS